MEQMQGALDLAPVPAPTIQSPPAGDSGSTDGTKSTRSKYVWVAGSSALREERGLDIGLTSAAHIFNRNGAGRTISAKGHTDDEAENNYAEAVRAWRRDENIF